MAGSAPALRFIGPTFMKLGSVASSVIQANRGLSFEDDLSLGGGGLYCVVLCFTVNQLSSSGIRW